MFSTSAFILYRQCAGTFFPKEKSDIKKLIQDFITYAAINLSWFNINFLLCSMPLIVMLILNPLLEKHYDDLHPEDEEKGIQLKWLIWILWVCHMIQFVTKVRIYSDDDVPKIGSQNQSLSTDQDETDDHYKKAFNINDVDDTGPRQPKTPSRYIHFKRTFNDDGPIRWIIFGLIYLAIFITYMFSKSNDVIYGLYLPIDFCLTAGLALFYFYYRH